MKIENLSNEIIMEWDVVNWSRALPFWQKKTSLNLVDSKCLELGSRNGGLCLWLSNICKNVVYSDIAVPTQKCIELHAQYKPTNIQYKIIDATKPIELESQKLIVTKSIIGTVDLSLRAAMIKNIYDNLDSGGEYWFVENLKGSWLHQFLRNNCVPWGKHWTYLKVEEVSQTFSMFKEIEFVTFGFLGTLGRNNFQRNVLGFIDKLFFDKLVPKRMHYIVAGVARK